MLSNLEFLLGLLERADRAFVAQEDFDGSHGPLLRLCQEMGFLSQEPGLNPVASCPSCGEGVPYLVSGRYVCSRCASPVDRRHLFLWSLDLEKFLRWLADRLGLRGVLRRIDACLWQLGTWEVGGDILECFYRPGGLLADAGKARLSAYRRALVLYGLSAPPLNERYSSSYISLLELVSLNEAFAVTDLRPLLRPKGNVRFDAHSGALWVGEAWLGEVPVGSKEFFFLGALASHQDRFVAYADLKHEVLRQAGSRDTTDEATFCQGLKSRIKKKWIPKIDLLIATTNKADGYRLRGYAEL